MICRRLDGIPLALELAAARLRTMPAAEIAVRLDDRFGLLASGPRTAQPRHRSLRGMVDWSWELLSEPERVLLRRLAVFAGGWSREAAEAVCDRAAKDDGGVRLGPSRPSIPEVLSALVDRSLVVSDDWRGSRRYRLLDTIRHYAEERLCEAGEEADLRARHLDWAMCLAEQAEAHLWTGEQKAWMERLDGELPNLRAALAWSLESRQTESGMRIAGGIWHFWEQRGHLAEARQWVGALLAPPTSEPTVARAKAVGFAAYFAYLQGDRDAAEPLADEAMKLARAADDPFAIVAALFYQAILAGTAGEVERAQACLQEALARSREAGLEFGIRVSLMNLGEAARMRGDDRAAAALLEELLALCEAAGDGYVQGYALMSLGQLRLHQGDLADATRRFRRALAIAHDLDHVHTLPHPLEGLAWTAAAAGLAERATSLLGAASELRAAVGGTLYPHWQADHEGAAETARSVLGDRAFAAAWRRGRALSRGQAVAYALEEPKSA